MVAGGVDVSLRDAPTADDGEPDLALLRDDGDHGRLLCVLGGLPIGEYVYSPIGFPLVLHRVRLSGMRHPRSGKRCTKQVRKSREQNSGDNKGDGI
jgi:hypothetical protein